VTNKYTTDYLYDAVRMQKDLKSKPEKYWVKRGEDMALNLFHEAAERVPAYKDFLRKRKIDHKKIKTINDFKKVPTTDKDNYLRKYDRKDLCWDGDFKGKSWVVSATSGSTGDPFYFPRTDIQDAYYALTAELYLRENFKIQDKSTLYIDAFAMGAWIGGIFTYEAIKKVSERGYRLSIATPGILKQEVINSVKNLGSEFDQVIIGCYPPMLKDIIDYGNEEGLDWAVYNLGIVFSAEGFDEDFRDYIIRNASLKDEYLSSLNHYGTADLGTMSHETAASILLRRQMLADSSLRKDIIEDTKKLPSVTQFIPEMFFFEEQNNLLICTSPSGYPLIRYDLKDRGNVRKYEEVEGIYKTHGKSFKEELKTKGIDKSFWNLPFVSIFDRIDSSVTLVGGIIYPEEIKRVLIKDTYNEIFTGKFTLEVVKDKDMDSKLVVNVEARKNISLKKIRTEELVEDIVKELLANNSEYASNYSQYGSKLHPDIVIWPHSYVEYFSGKGKQKWVIK